tara:strand:- start:1108 stop:1224 length:117 start_codon:yes stop_codon:yes gene_type:complete
MLELGLHKEYAEADCGIELMMSVVAPAMARIELKVFIW